MTPAMMTDDDKLNIAAALVDAGCSFPEAMKLAAETDCGHEEFSRAFVALFGEPPQAIE